MFSLLSTFKVCLPNTPARAILNAHLPGQLSPYQENPLACVPQGTLHRNGPVLGKKGVGLNAF